MSKQPPNRRRDGFPEPEGELRRTLDFINDLSTRLSSASGEEVHEQALISLLRVALQATRNLNGHVLNRLDESAVRQFVNEIVATQHHWPIPYSEVEELRKYSALHIGYLAIPSRCPRKRTGDTIFSEYALALVLKIRVLRGEYLLKSAELEPETRSALELRVKYHAHQWATDLPVDALQEPIRAIAAYRPKDWKTIQDIPEFTKDTKEAWRNAALEILAEVLPFPNEITELARRISDKDVDGEGQIKARIRMRIGRAVIALAP